MGLSTDSTQLYGKQPTKLVKTFERDLTVGSIVTDLLSRYSGPFGGMAPTGHRQLRVTISRNSMENSLRKLMKKFEHDPRSDL